MKSVVLLLGSVAIAGVAAFGLERVREATGFCLEKWRVLSDAELHALAVPVIERRTRPLRSDLSQYPYKVFRFSYPGSEGPATFDPVRRALSDEYVVEVRIEALDRNYFAYIDECGRSVPTGVL